MIDRVSRKCLASMVYFIFPQYISETNEDELIKYIDQQPWRTNLSRQTQHYGYVYDYRAKRIDSSMCLGELPSWLQSIAIQLHDDGLIPGIPDQAIINEYQPGQGIADHIDCIPCFGDVVISLSLAVPVVMDLKYNGRSIPILLEPRSLLVFQNEARYQFVGWVEPVVRPNPTQFSQWSGRCRSAFSLIGRGRRNDPQPILVGLWYDREQVGWVEE